MSPLLTAALCAAAVGLGLPSPVTALLAARVGPSPGSGTGSVAWFGRTRPPRPGRRLGLPAGRWPGGLVVLGGATGVASVAASRPGVTVLPLTLTVLVVSGLAAVLASRSRAAVRARVQRSGVIEACDALAAGLRAGQPPQRVLDRVAADVPTLRTAAAAARLGGDIPATLRAASGLDGAEGLASVAAAWTVAQRSGAGLADVVARIAGSVRSEAEQRHQIEVALGTSRSTARLLAGLPLMGVALGSGMDADPLGVLFGSAAGAWCLLSGAVLAATGLLWVERIGAGASR